MDEGNVPVKEFNAVPSSSMEYQSVKVRIVWWVGGGFHSHLLRFVNTPILSGILPVRKFSLTSRYSKLVSFSISDGMDPVIAFPSKLNSLRPESSPVAVGIGPMISLLCKVICSVVSRSQLWLVVLETRTCKLNERNSQVCLPRDVAPEISGGSDPPK